MSREPMWRRYVRLWGPDPRADIDDEMEFHISMMAEDLMRQGVDPKSARARAEREFGDADRARAECRQIGEARLRRSHRAAWLEELAHDVRFAVRGFRKSPGLAVVIVLTLALGIGASSAVFTLVDQVLLRPLPYAEPERLAAVWEMSPRSGEANVVSPANYRAWEAESRSFERLSAYANFPVSLTGTGEPMEVKARLTSADYFATLGAGAALGRTYQPGEDSAQVAVLSHSLWVGRFGGSPRVIGETVTLDDDIHTIIGVMPPGHTSVGEQPDLWVPVAWSPEGRGRFLAVVGRLAPGATLAGAAREMETLAAGLAAEFPERNTGWSTIVRPLHEEVAGPARAMLLILFGAVGLLLLMACSSVANLLMGRMASRQREIALRSSLGASRVRIVRQMLTEGLVLGAAAGTLGVVMAMALTRALAAAASIRGAIPRLDEAAVDLRVVAFAAAVSVLTVVVFATLPALVGASVAPSSVLRGAGRGITGGHGRLRSALVAAQVAIAVVLLAGAGLLARSYQELMETELGLRTEGVLTMQTTLPWGSSRYPDEEAVRNFTERLQSELEAIPGVSAAGTIARLPMKSKSADSFWREDRPLPGPGEDFPSDIRFIGGDYHRAMGIPLLKGRVLDERERADAPMAFVVNEALARRAFPGEEVLGKRIAFQWGDTIRGEIVGVVGSVRELGPAQEAAPAIYISSDQMPSNLIGIVLRTSGEPEALARAAVQAVHRVDPNQPVADIRAMESVVGETVTDTRLSTLVLGVFAIGALLLAALGLYGVTSFAVGQRRGEIGVRVALGASHGSILRMVVGNALRLTALGLAAGLLAAFALTRLLRSLLFGVEPTDPLTLAAVVLFLAGVAFVAGLIPARRASRIDPMVALRNE